MTVMKTTVVLAAATLASIAISLPANAATAPYRFANCDAMHRVFPHGVGQFGAKDHTSGTPVTNFARAPRWYAMNTGSDRDKDRIACEAA
jgi:hypothetical protein